MTVRDDQYSYARKQAIKAMLEQLWSVRFFRCLIVSPVIYFLGCLALAGCAEKKTNFQDDLTAQEKPIKLSTLSPKNSGWYHKSTDESCERINLKINPLTTVPIDERDYFSRRYLGGFPRSGRKIIIPIVIPGQNAPMSIFLGKSSRPKSYKPELEVLTFVTMPSDAIEQENLSRINHKRSIYDDSEISRKLVLNDLDLDFSLHGRAFDPSSIFDSAKFEFGEIDGEFILRVEVFEAMRLSLNDDSRNSPAKKSKYLAKLTSLHELDLMCKL